MRQGLHFGRRPPDRGVGRLLAVLLALLVASVVHLVIYQSERRALSRQGDELESLRGDARVELDRMLADPSRQRAIRGLAAASRSGVAIGLKPSDVLDMLAESLPEGVRIVGLSLRISESSPSLSFDAVASRSELVSELQERIGSGRFVRSTEVLEERLLTEGGWAVRLRADLEKGLAR